MAKIPSSSLEKLKELTNSISLELVFAEAGKDAGLLPLNNLFGQLEEHVAADWPDALTSGFGSFRALIDRVFENGGNFDATTITQLNGWVQWLVRCWDNLGLQQALPAHPQFGAPAPAPAPVMAAAPTSVDLPEEPLVMNIESDGDLIREFTNESHEHLQNVELGILRMEENPNDKDTINSMFRAFHTFKGGSGFLNLKPINQLAHELESLLDLARKDVLVIDAEVINVILTGGDILAQFVTEIELQLVGTKPLQPFVVATRPLIARVHAIMNRGPSRAAAPVVAAPVPENVVQMPPPAPTPVAAATPAPVSAGKPAQAPAGDAAAGGAGATSIKVDTVKLDSLIDLVGEMVIAQSLVSQHPDIKSIQNQQFIRNLSQLVRITNELQKTAMSLRMVPVRGTFQKMQRLVRDVAVKSGKQVELVTVGEETELDRTITEEISDPLVHMIRNSVDHGIEKPDDRIKKGKSPVGKVTLSAFHQGGSIVIQIQDDGAGLNKERILKKAVENGIIQPGQQLEDKDIFALIFAAGFSTAEVVTDLSGRGVGMDVVRRNIEKLRGKIEIQSTPDKGSIFTISLPLTLAIIDGMIVGVGHHRYIIPTLSVRESFRPTPEMLSTVQQRGEIVNVRGRISPLVRLHEVFGVQPQSTDPTQSIVIVIESGNDHRCLMVDHLIGKQEVVIKSLGETFKANKALAGAAILGDGRVGLIVDVDSLVKLKAAPIQKAA